LSELDSGELDSGGLKSIYPDPTPRVIAKARPELDAHARKFIEMSPFCVLATSGADGSVDASPRGGHPGFIRVAGPNALLMPDRAGNNRIDSFKNIVEGSGCVQLIFFVPGIDETLRVGGRAGFPPSRNCSPQWRNLAGRHAQCFASMCRKRISIAARR
jgi:uncharacterized protein